MCSHPISRACYEHRGTRALIAAIKAQATGAFVRLCGTDTPRGLGLELISASRPADNWKICSNPPASDAPTSWRPEDPQRYCTTNTQTGNSAHRKFNAGSSITVAFLF
jgi:hypothetical protein